MTNRLRQSLAIACLLLSGLFGVSSVAEAQSFAYRPHARLRVATPARVAPRADTYTSLTSTSLSSLGIRSQTQLHPDPVAEPAGSGQLHCTVLANDLRANGMMEVRLEGRVIATGTCGSALEVPAGDYHVTLTLTDSLDRPQRTVPVTVTEDGIARAQTRFAIGTVYAAVQDGRTRVRGNALVYQNGRYIGSIASGGTAQLAAGRYELVLRWGTQTQSQTVDVIAGQRVGAIARF